MFYLSLVVQPIRENFQHLPFKCFSMLIRAELFYGEIQSDCVLCLNYHICRNVESFPGQTCTAYPTRVAVALASHISCSTWLSHVIAFYYHYLLLCCLPASDALLVISTLYCVTTPIDVVLLHFHFVMSCVECLSLICIHVYVFHFN